MLPELKEVLSKILAQEQNGVTALEAVLTALFKKALKGDVRASQELLDRYFGKVPQKLDANVNQMPTIVFRSADEAETD